MSDIVAPKLLPIFFSVIIPVYNVQNYLPNCLEHVINQTYPSFEVILVNDGSTDSCLEICEEYTRKDKRIRLINKNNEGLLLARRTGLKYASGDYVVHIDSDDYCDYRLLEQLNEFICKHNCDLIIYGYSIVDNQGNELRRVSTGFDDVEMSTISKSELLRKMLDTTDLNNIWIKCAKREIIDISEDYSHYGRLMMGEDVLQTMPLIENATQIGFINKPLYMYRVNPSGMSRSIRPEYVLHYLSVRARFLTALKRTFAEEILVNKFYANFAHGLANYLIKVTAACTKREYNQLIDRVKDSVSGYQELIMRNSGPSDKVCLKLCMLNMYYLARLIRKVYFGK